MANLVPFHAYRYAAPALQNLVTQPYDKISPAMRERYLALDPHNLVRVILGQPQPGDNAQENVYIRAAAHFAAWREQGVLKRDPRPAFYPYFQEFTAPDSGDRLLRKGFIGLGEVEPYEAKVVHRHEYTLAGPKKDRRQVLDHTGAHFGQLFMLYQDRACAVDALLDKAMAAGPLATVRDEYDALHTLGRIDDPALIAEVRALMSDKKLLIADGHHRYETALAYRQDHPEDPAARFVMMTFVNMYSPGLRILATHRLVSGLASLTVEQLQKTGFTVTRLAALDALKAAWAEPHADRIRIGVALAGQNGLLLLEKARGPLELDVTALHGDILDRGLGISPEAVRNEQFLRYIRGVDAAVAEVHAGKAQAGFLLEPCSVDDVAAISFGGGVMPQKSTDFYPKLLTGMAIYRLADGLS